MPLPVNGEVTIICLTDLVELPDLGLRLTRGTKVGVPLSSAMKSRDLSKAKMDGTVSTQTLRASAIRAQEHVSSDTTTSQAPRYNPVAPVDLTPLLEAIRVLTEEVRAMRVELAARPAAVINMDLLVARLREVTPDKVREAPRDEPRVVFQDEPMFIPSGLTGDGLETSLDVAAHSSEAPGLTDAAKALKTVRSARRR